MSQTAEERALKEEVAELQQHLARLSLVQQQLIDTRNRLDRELERFAGIQAYNTRAIAIRDRDRFAELTVETALELFEVEFALLWPTSPMGRPEEKPCAVIGLETEEVTNQDLRALVVSERFQRAGTSLLSAQELADNGLEQLRQLGVSVCTGPGGTRYALLIAGVSLTSGDFHGGLSSEHLQSFTVFGQQIGALLQNRADQATIEGQMAQLRIEQQRLSLALDGSNAGLWDWEVDTGHLFVSDRWQAMLGYGPGELEPVIQEWEDRVHPEDLAPSQARLAAHLQGETEVYEHVYRLRHKDGYYLWILSLAKALRDGNGVTQRMVGINVDVTEQRRARERAEAADRAKSEFLANMSHEIRTPLNAVLGLAQLLEAEAWTSRQRDMLAHIRSAGRSLLGLLNDILDLSRIEAGELRIDCQPFALSSLLDQISTLMAPMARAKHLDWRLEAPVIDDDLLGDSLRLEQVLVNLIGNAIKFTQQGQVHLRLSFQDAGPTGLRLRGEVRDTGIGISPEVQQRLFLPFTQADSGTTRRFGGSGLGLSICKRLIDLMDGEIGVISAPGQGSTFWFDLPLRRVPRVATAGALPGPEITPTGPRLAGARILVVDDSPINLDVVDRFLNREGARPTLVSDGQQALDCLRRAPQDYDAVLMDMQMPVLDGYQATRAIRQDHRFSALPIIAFSAGVLREEQRLMFDAGVSDFVPKPVELDRLVSVLARWIGRPLTAAVATPPPAPDASDDFPLIPGLDRDRARSQFDGDCDFFLQVLRRFGADLPAQLAAIADHLDQGDHAAAGAALHKLRGSAANLGAGALVAAIQGIEAALKAGADLTSPRASYEQASQALTQALAPWLAPVQQAAPVDPRLEGLLAELASQLARNRYDAKRTSQEVAALVAGTPQAQTFEPVVEAVRRLRFQEALEVLKALGDVAA